MRNLTSSMLLLCAVTLALSGCKSTDAVSASEGAGFATLTPARPTMAYIINNDAPFARQVLGHNAMCGKMPACQK